MSDTSNSHVGQTPRSAAGPTIITTVVIALCLIACTLIFLLPADSLVVDLVYQGF